jgi:site-specific DNA-methyltransferase (adenine-specific)
VASLTIRNLDEATKQALRVRAAQHATRDVYAFVPDLPLDQEWTDAKLYKRYGLTEEEIAFIESQVAEHDDTVFDEGAAEADDA